VLEAPPALAKAQVNLDVTAILYAQCWEDADVLLEALNVRPGDVCLSIAGAGDNTLALLAKSPARVFAVDLSPAQLNCLELRVAAFRALAHSELLELMGSAPSRERRALYAKCRPHLAPQVRDFWDARPRAIADGIGSAGNFERYFAIFRRFILPLIHSRGAVNELLSPKSRPQRERFYQTRWNTRRWRFLFHVFFSEMVMSRLGRDPQFFKYAEGPFAESILRRTRHALTVLDPSRNPYVDWILTGRHSRALPFALRPENFQPIRDRLDRLELRCQSLEEFLDSVAPRSIGAFNLSDVFEYMSVQHSEETLERIARAGRPGARLAYWNMLAPRRRPDAMASKLASLDELAQRLGQEAKAFFYSAFVIEEVL